MRRSVQTLFSYVVDHDHGFAPNPYDGYCTLVHCKFGGERGRQNIVEMAKVGDWIVGTGGRNKNSSGGGTLLYLMRVDEKLPFQDFLTDKRFRGRSDSIDLGSGNKFALISRKYFYFGGKALKISDLPRELAGKGLVKKGPGLRRDYPAKTLKVLVRWFESRFAAGMHGDPCTVGRVDLRLGGQRIAKEKTSGNDRSRGCI
jgi:hypothetical protein